MSVLYTFYSHHDVVFEGVEARHGDQPPGAGTECVEDLSGRITPHLRKMKQDSC